MPWALGGQLLWVSLLVVLFARGNGVVPDYLWWSALVGLMTASAAVYNLVFRLRFRNKKRQPEKGEKVERLRAVGTD